MVKVEGSLDEIRDLPGFSQSSTLDDIFEYFIAQDN
jgi:hypothetical protein